MRSGRERAASKNEPKQEQTERTNESKRIEDDGRESRVRKRAKRIRDDGRESSESKQEKKNVGKGNKDL